MRRTTRRGRSSRSANRRGRALLPRRQAPAPSCRSYRNGSRPARRRPDSSRRDANRRWSRRPRGSIARSPTVSSPLGLDTAPLDHSGACDAEPAAPVILQVVPALDTGGAERTTIDIARAVREAGWIALVATRGGRMAPELAQAGSELIRMPLESKSPWVIWANAGRLARLIRERNISLIHARSRAPAWSALLAARRCRIPFVTTYHGIY